MNQPSQQLLEEITAKHSMISSCEAATAGPHWGAMHKLLLKAKVDSMALLRVVGSRDMDELNRIIARLRGEDVAPAPIEPISAVAAIDPTLLQTALKTFRRRIKFSQLDAQSKLARSPLSSGASHQINSMIPPREFPLEVWDALVQAGKLRREGQGFYALTDDNSQQHW